MPLFTVAEEPNHHVADAQCPECEETYPMPCRCGGLMHAAGTGEEDEDGNPWLATLCDKCGLSEEEQEEP